jgi:hypothetical protein
LLDGEYASHETKPSSRACFTPESTAAAPDRRSFTAVHPYDESNSTEPSITAATSDPADETDANAQPPTVDGTLGYVSHAKQSNVHESNDK